MSMMGVLVRRVVQPGLHRVSGNSESKRDETDQSSERCLFDDMHLASQKAKLFRHQCSQRACQRSDARTCEKTGSFSDEECDAFV